MHIVSNGYGSYLLNLVSDLLLHCARQLDYCSPLPNSFSSYPQNVCRFFPIFFAEEVKLSPVAVNVLMAAQPVVIGLCATAGQLLSRFIGEALRFWHWTFVQYSMWSTVLSVYSPNGAA